jgi:hypothetical protein
MAFLSFPITPVLAKAGIGDDTEKPLFTKLVRDGYNDPYL